MRRAWSPVGRRAVLRLIVITHNRVCLADQAGESGESDAECLLRRRALTALSLLFGRATGARGGCRRYWPPSCVVDREAISVEDNGPALSVQVGGSHAVRDSLLLPNDGRPFELDAVAFRILQVDRWALAFGTVAQGRRTAGDALPGKMFGNRRRVERLNP